MRLTPLLVSFPWFASLLAGCGDDATAGEAGTQTETGGTDGSSTTAAPPMTADGSSTADGSATVDGSSTADGSATSDGTSSTGDTEGTGANAAPEAVPDTFFARQGVTLLVEMADGVLANDSDPEGGGLTVTAYDASSAQGAMFVVGGDGVVAYIPPVGHWGPDSFGYTVEDDAGQSATTTATVHVAPNLIPLGAVALGSGGFALDGEAEANASGRSVSQAGDVNGDGVDDIIIGAPNADANGFTSGRSYVVFGKADTSDGAAQRCHRGHRRLRARR